MYIMINAQILKNALLRAAQSINAHRDEVDGINYFPVPDGDTGTNLSMTLSSCAEAIADCETDSAGELADTAAAELLMGARGNSGVIFSLIFKGFADNVRDRAEIDGSALAHGLEAGCTEAYSCVERPVEGTMLTVIRIAASRASAAADKGGDAKAVFEAAVAGAKAALKSTPNLLPILKKSGAVDSGGQGLVYIMEAMLGSAEQPSERPASAAKAAKAPAGDIRYTYCTEFIIRNSSGRGIASLSRLLTSIGDCAAAAEHSGIIKVHVHTDFPNLAIEKGLEYGELDRIKIDNMRLQASSFAAAQSN